ncbi:MAG: hypothetical protein AAF441_15640 [Pseudomonadota bacterium]
MSEGLRRTPENSVYINCPYDPEYLTGTLPVIMFTVLSCGYFPRCAREESPGRRFRNIVNIMSECQFAIHDLCRVEVDGETNLPRFNVPLELGLYLGSSYTWYVGDVRDASPSRASLIMESDRGRYHDFISNIKGHDIAVHDDQPENYIKLIRDFLNPSAVDPEQKVRIPTNAEIQSAYEQFRNYLADFLEREGPDYNYNDLFRFIVYCIRTFEWYRVDEA